MSEEKDQYVTYTVVTTPQTETTAAETVKVKIKKFRGGTAREWLRWSVEFRQLAKKKGWNDEQKGANLAVLLEGDMGTEVQQLVAEATKARSSFDEFYTQAHTYH